MGPVTVAKSRATMPCLTSASRPANNRERGPRMAESQANPQPPAGPSPQHLAQVKAFLSYLEDVEADEEIIEDIVAGLEEEYDVPADSDCEQSGAGSDNQSGNCADNGPGEGDDEFAQEGLIHLAANHLSEVLI